MSRNERVCMLYLKYKWIVLIFLTPLFLLSPAYKEGHLLLVITGLLILLHNAASNYIMIKKKKYFNLIRNTTPFIDMLFCTLIVIARGGLRSDAFILYIILFNVYAIIDGERTNLRLCISAMVLYFLSCVFFTVPSNAFYLERFLIRMSFFPLVTFTNIFIKRELNIAMKDLTKERQKARKDSLTGLWNRVMLDDVLTGIIKEHKLGLGKKYGILLIDLDDFKNINDSFGHDKGDYVLLNVAYCIRNSINRSDIPFRLGGDEFLILIRDCNEEKLHNYSEKIVTAINQLRFSFSNNVVHISVSIGGSLSSEGDFDEIFKLSDNRMYTAKNNGKNSAITY